MFSNCNIHEPQNACVLKLQPKHCLTIIFIIFSNRCFYIFFWWIFVISVHMLQPHAGVTTLLGANAPQEYLLRLSVCLYVGNTLAFLPSPTPLIWPFFCEKHSNVADSTLFFVKSALNVADLTLLLWNALQILLLWYCFHEKYCWFDLVFVKDASNIATLTMFFVRRSKCRYFNHVLCKALQMPPL